MEKYMPIEPGTKPFKRIFIKTIFFVLGRAFQSASRHDADLKAELAALPNLLKIQMQVQPNGPQFNLQVLDGRLMYLGLKPMASDITIYLKNIECAFDMFTAQMGVVEGYTGHRIALKGNPVFGMIFTRCLFIVQAYLFPKIINKRVMRRVPPMPLKKQLFRIWIYCLGIPLGV